jgi:ubiquinone/menaquinone biosynthesis C-methylase UbiE
MDSVTIGLKQAKTFPPSLYTQDLSQEPRVVPPRETKKPEIPHYMQDIYYWAYLNPRNVRWLDHELIVRLILWEQHAKLRRAAFAEIEPGQKVLQSTCVYGKFLPMLAELIGPEGHLDVVDIAEVQLNSAQRKLNQFSNVSLHHADVMDLGDESYDSVICYFLLHEIPDQDKRKAANVLLRKVRPGGKLIFIDYHKPHWAHPLKPITSFVFDTLEPFAKGMWKTEIEGLAEQPELFSWSKQKFFGSLFQKVVAQRL